MTGGGGREEKGKGGVRKEEEERSTWADLSLLRLPAFSAIALLYTGHEIHLLRTGNFRDVLLHLLHRVLQQRSSNCII